MKKLREILSEVECIYIPAYQRGYRWTRDEVYQLLDDLAAHDQSRGGYFLQVLAARKGTVCHNGIRKSCLRIIDGQQRLTTAMLILNACSVKQVLPEVVFESRGDAGGIIDEYFRQEATCEIERFFTQGENHDEKQISEKLLSCNFIYYTGVESEDEEMELFHRINMWKMPLRDSELVKCEVLADSETAAVRSAEWNELERWLHDDRVFYYLFDDDEEKLRDRMSTFLVVVIGSDKGNKYPVFSRLQHDIQDGDTAKNAIKEKWDSVLLAYRKCRDLMNDPVLYHLLGWRLHKRVQEGALKKVLSDSQEALLPREVDCKVPLDYVPGDANDAIRDYLLLANVAYCALGYADHYDFEQHVRHNPRSIEHIHARNQDTLSWETFKEIFETKHLFKDPLDKVYKDYSDRSGKDRDEAEKYLAQLCKDAEGEKWKFEYPNMTLDNSLGNLALLTDSANSAFNNGEFSEKGRLLRTNDEIGWVPPLTRAVFFKLIPGVNNTPLWCKDDRDTYGKFMQTIIKQFADIAARRVVV